MSTKKIEPAKKIKIIVHTYWPTRVIKSITIKDNTEIYSNDLTFTGEEACYIAEQLNTIFSGQQEAKK